MAPGSGLRAPGRDPEPRALSPERLVRLVVVGLFVWLVRSTDAWAFGGSGARVWLPEGISSYAPTLDRLFYTVLWITGAVFVLVQGTLLVFLVRYRRRPGRTAAYTHGNTMVEVVWTVIPTLILIGLGTYNQQVWSVVKGTPPPADLEVGIIGEQFAWNIRYAGADGQLHTEDDLTTINQLHLPVGRTVLLRLRSKDVIHSFFVSQFRVKQDAVPGLTVPLWVQAVKSGQYDIACAELCGLGHYRMRGFLTVESPDAFNAWIAQLQAEQFPPPAPAALTEPAS